MAQAARQRTRRVMLMGCVSMDSRSWRRRDLLADNADADVAHAQCRSVITESRRHALEGRRLIPSAAAHDGQTGRKAVDRIDARIAWTLRPAAAGDVTAKLVELPLQ